MNHLKVIGELVDERNELLLMLEAVVEWVGLKSDERIFDGARRLIAKVRCEQCPICGEDHKGAVPLACETGDGV